MIRVLTIFLLIAFLLPSCTGKEETSLDAKKAPPSTVEVVLVKPTDVVREITVPGTIIPNEEVQLYSEVSGRITAIHFQEGQTVSKGTLLIEMDNDILKAQKRQLLVDLDLAQKDEIRKKSLYENKGLSLEEYEKVASKLEATKAQIELLNVQLSKTMIRAPFSGRIGFKKVSEGAFITSSTLITTIVQENPVKVEFSVSEKYAGTVRAGQLIRFKQGQNNKEYEARVYASESIIDEGTRMLSVRARLQNDGKLIPGAFVSLTYNLGMEADAFMVPTESIIPILKGQKVLLVRSGLVVEIPVEIGIRTADKVQVIGDLKKGDQVLISGLLAVRPGMPVKTKQIDR